MNLFKLAVTLGLLTVSLAGCGLLSDGNSTAYPEFADSYSYRRGDEIRTLDVDPTRTLLVTADTSLALQELFQNETQIPRDSVVWVGSNYGVKTFMVVQPVEDIRIVSFLNHHPTVFAKPVFGDADNPHDLKAWESGTVVVTFVNDLDSAELELFQSRTGLIF